jgi:hypothetical protein
MVLENLYQKGFKQLGSDQTRINRMLSDSILHKEDRHLAAMAMVTNAILNLDEVITKN